MDEQDSTVGAELKRVPIEIEFLRLEIEGPDTNQRFPLVYSGTHFTLGLDPPERWVVHWNVNRLAVFTCLDRDIAEVEITATLGQRVRLANTFVRILDLRTLHPYSLVLKRDGQPDSSWDLNEGSYLVGRPGKRQNDISLAHPSVSRSHARLDIGHDMSSVFVQSQAALSALNGEKLEAGSHRQLQSGDRLQLGIYVFRWHKEAEAIKISPSGFTLSLLGGFQIKDSRCLELTVKTEKSRAILARLAIHRYGHFPVTKMLDTLWPDKSLTRQRKNLSHALKALQSDLALCDEDFSEMIPRSQGGLGLNSKFFKEIDIWTLQDSALKGAETLTVSRLLSLHRGPFIPEFQEFWTLRPRCQLFLSWLDLIRGSEVEIGHQQALISAIAENLSQSLYEEFVYKACFELAVEWEQIAMAELLFWDYRERLQEATGEMPSQAFCSLYESQIGRLSDRTRIELPE